MLLQAGAEADARDPRSGRTPLHLAAVKGHRDVVANLLAGGAPLNLKDDAGHTPLQLAARYGHQGLAELLADHGARVALAARTKSELLAVQAEINTSGGKAISVPTDSVKIWLLKCQRVDCRSTDPDY